MTEHEKTNEEPTKCIIIINSPSVFILQKHYNLIRIFMGDTDVKSDNNIIRIIFFVIVRNRI